MGLIVDRGCGRHEDCIGYQKSLSRPWRSALFSGPNNSQELDERHVSSKQGCRIDYRSFITVQLYIYNS